MRTVQVEGWKMSGVRLGVINKAWGKFLRFLQQDELHTKLEFPCTQNREILYKLVSVSGWRKPHRHEVGLLTGIYLIGYLSGRTLIVRWDSKMNSGIYTCLNNYNKYTGWAQICFFIVSENWRWSNQTRCNIRTSVLSNMLAKNVDTCSVTCECSDVL